MRTKVSNYFESKVRIEKMQEDGTTAKINEMFVIDAMSFSEVEARVIKYVTMYNSGEFEVLTEVRAKYKEIFFSDKDAEEKYYRAQVSFITLDEKSGREKRSKNTYLVQGSSIESARKNIDEVMAGSMVDYVIESLAESAVVDIITDAEKTQEQ